jgi:diguanylate cyclase (GGDEF)-like protein
MRDEGLLEDEISRLLEAPEYDGHPMRDAQAALCDRYRDKLSNLERLTSLSDGYQSVLRDRNQSLADRYRKQIRQLQKIVRISDHYQQMLHDVNESLHIASTQDPLTGLPNRRLMLDRLNSEAALVERQKTTFCLALIDIDHFKQINDQFGHDVGDAVLVDIARTLAAGLRAYDICARWGGEEFMVLLPETTGPSSVEIAQRLQEHVNMMHHDRLPKGQRPSVSVGLAECNSTSSLADTIKRADMALYEAKCAGRNTFVRADA